MQDKEQHQQRRPGRRPRPDSVVIDDDDRVLDPATDVGTVGRLGRGGTCPLGYYKDPEKSARDVPRDRRRALLGARRLRPRSRRTARSRCSAAARTASTPAGRRSTPRRSRWRSRPTPPCTTSSWSASPTRSTARPSPRSSQLREGAQRSSSRTCATFLRAHLSGYKLPRALTVVDQIPRNATGKAQYPGREGAGDGRLRRQGATSTDAVTLGSTMRTALCDALRHRATRSSPSPRPSTSPPRSRAPAASACSAASGSTTPTSSSGR